jgi:hypothetical protein
MLQWWTNFASFHDPNGQDVEDPLWPTAEGFTEGVDPSILRISADSVAQTWPET